MEPGWEESQRLNAKVRERGNLRLTLAGAKENSGSRQGPDNTLLKKRSRENQKKTLPAAREMGVESGTRKKRGNSSISFSYGRRKQPSRRQLAIHSGRVGKKTAWKGEQHAHLGEGGAEVRQEKKNATGMETS